MKTTNGTHPWPFMSHIIRNSCHGGDCKTIAVMTSTYPPLVSGHTKKRPGGQTDGCLTPFNQKSSDELKTYERGHTEKRPGQPETARVLEITPVVLEYCLNRIFVEIIYGYIIVLNKVLF